MRVLVTSGDVRVHWAVTRLLGLTGDRVVGATDAPHLLADPHADLGADLVVLELDGQSD